MSKAETQNESAAPVSVSFSDLQLAEPLLAALDEVGYETPSPIQAEAIPHLLQGLDLLGHAPTGTGKTAAFALPLLSRLKSDSGAVQVLTLAPTRELAIQVAEAFKRYASHMKDFHVLPIYGGQEYGGQIRQLKRGVQVVVGTPGRVMDHMRKGTLKLDGLQALVLDEADEMLRMGFIDEVEWILEQTPPQRQMALFSATMPKQIERIARKYLNKPQEIAIKAKTATAETIRQRFFQVSAFHKLDALTRILEVEPFDAIIMFVRTKTLTVELAERLEARGYAAAAMNGDMAQKDRERMVERLKNRKLDILVATDVAARGLDVERISHVVNYDIPYDAEAYIHRIGRTGRAGRTGEAILFVAPRERRMLGMIEKATRQKIEKLELPSTEAVNNKRIANFKQNITDTLAAGELAFMRSVIEQYRDEHDVPAIEIAAAMAQISLGDQPLLLDAEQNKLDRIVESAGRNDGRRNDRKDDRRGDRRERKPGNRGDKPGRERSGSVNSKLDNDKERYRIDVGRRHGVKPGNIVGAIANEAGLDGAHIGGIEISEDHTLVDLPKGMPKEIFKSLRKTRVCGQPLNLTLVAGGRKSSGEKSGGKSGVQSGSKSGSKPGSKKKRNETLSTKSAAAKRGNKNTKAKGGKQDGKKDDWKKGGPKKGGPNKGGPKKAGPKKAAPIKAGKKTGHKKPS